MRVSILVGLLGLVVGGLACGGGADAPGASEEDALSLALEDATQGFSVEGLDRLREARSSRPDVAEWESDLLGYLRVSRSRPGGPLGTPAGAAGALVGGRGVHVPGRSAISSV